VLAGKHTAALNGAQRLAARRAQPAKETAMEENEILEQWKSEEQAVRDRMRPAGTGRLCPPVMTARLPGLCRALHVACPARLHPPQL
jgi:hypothetical protein